MVEMKNTTGVTSIVPLPEYIEVYAEFTIADEEGKPSAFYERVLFTGVDVTNQHGTPLFLTPDENGYFYVPIGTTNFVRYHYPKAWKKTSLPEGFE